MKALVGAFNQEKALVGAFSVIVNLRMDLRFKLYNQGRSRFKKRYFTFWNNYNIITNSFFLIGLIIRMLEYVLPEQETAGDPDR